MDAQMVETSDKIKREMIQNLSWSLKEGKHGLNAVPGLLKQVLDEKMWVMFEVEIGNEIVIVEPKNFLEFVTKQPPKGLGSSVKMLEKICYEHTEVLGLITLEVKKDRGEHEGNQYTMQLDNNGNVDIINISNLKNQRPDGTSKSASLRRLSSEIDKAETEEKREELETIQKQVFNNEISVHKALITIGVRRETFTIPVDPISAAKSIKKRFTLAQIAHLIALLTEAP
jgi:hypothetical protein